MHSSVKMANDQKSRGRRRCAFCFLMLLLHHEIPQPKLSSSRAHPLGVHGDQCRSRLRRNRGGPGPALLLVLFRETGLAAVPEHRSLCGIRDGCNTAQFLSPSPFDVRCNSHENTVPGSVARPSMRSPFFETMKVISSGGPCWLSIF